jgi:FkbM family methyltransferase
MGKDYGWRWNQFQGSADGLRWNRRDLAENLDPVLAEMKSKKVAVQAGGNLGIFPKRMAQEFKTVYTFEPDPDNFRMMCANAPEGNILKFQAALGFERGLVGICKERRDGKPRTHEGLCHVAGAGTVPVFQIDDLSLPECDIIQLDLEGFELYALYGARNTIERCRPILMIEINKSLGFMGLREDDVRNAIRMMGYDFQRRINSDEIWTPRA